MMLFLARRLPLRYFAAGIVQVFLFFTCFAQQKQIKGVITTESNTPLFGATITVKSSDTRVVTDSAGSFTMHANEGDVLVISYNGYKSKELKIINQTSLTISLSQSAINFDEILVPGDTSQKVREITGSVAAVKPKYLAAVPPGTEELMLEGRVAGLKVVTCAERGGPVEIRLHEVGNFGDVNPLCIIDGIEGNINALNPYDIESLQVLKDSAAYSIYGPRGANGVIIITTGKGKPCKTLLSYDLYSGVTKPLNKDLNLLSPQAKKKSE